MVSVRPLEQSEVGEAWRIIRHAFGTYIGVPDLDKFWTDLDHVHSRFGAEHIASFAAEYGGELAGVNFATNWGSVGFFGPLAVRPDLWDRGLSKPLVEAAAEQFDRWGTRHAGLATFPQSMKHVGLYQKFGFYPRFLTALMTAPVSGDISLAREDRYSGLAEGERQEVEEATREVTEEIFPGLDLRGEIRTVAARLLGDTLLVWEGSRLGGFAVCHWGPKSEAGAERLVVKFGAVRPGDGAAKRFDMLLDGVTALARSAGMPNVMAGVNLAREEAYRQMMARGFKSQRHMVLMHRPNEGGYSRPGVWVLDDWR